MSALVLSRWRLRASAYVHCAAHLGLRAFLCFSRPLLAPHAHIDIIAAAACAVTNA